MGSANAVDRNDYNHAASETAQTRFNAVATRLETLMTQRDADVKQAMADYEADGVSAEYHAKEARWNTVADEVKTIITTLRGSLGKNDETASTALAQAKAAVDNIG